MVETSATGTSHQLSYEPTRTSRSASILITVVTVFLLALSRASGDAVDFDSRGAKTCRVSRKVHWQVAA